MVPSCLDKQTASREPPHNWLVRLGMDLATFCGTYMDLKTASIDTIRAYNFLSQNPHYFITTHHSLWLYTTLHTYRIACFIDYLVKWQAIQLTIHCRVDPLNSLSDCRFVKNCTQTIFIHS